MSELCSQEARQQGEAALVEKGNLGGLPGEGGARYLEVLDQLLRLHFEEELICSQSPSE